MRIACVYGPELALQAVLRRDGARKEHEDAIALATGAGERAKVLAVTAAAQAAGVRRGMTVGQARAVASGRPGTALRVVLVAPADTAAAQAALCDVGYAFAPRIETEGERVFFEVGDLARMYADDRAAAQAVVARAGRVGLAVRVAVAASKAVARAAAQAHDVAVVPAGGERAFLASLPVATALRTFGETAESVELGERLRRWGIGTLGALAGLPPGEVALRLGPAGARLARLAAGRDDEAFLPSLPPDAIEEGTELDYPIHELDPLSFVLRALFDRALDRLACRGLACAGVTLRLKLDPRGFDVRDLPLAAPTREAKTLLEHLRLDLARRPPGAPVVGASILMLPARVRGVELDFFRPAGPAPEKLAATLARLAALVGAANVGAPAEVDTHREEALDIRPFPTSVANPVADPARAAAGDPARDAALALGFRHFRPPHPVEVLMDRDGPAALRGPHIAARVLVAAGPYRKSGEWWHDDGFSRDHWDVHASDGAVYRLHQDRRDACWYIDGYYD